MAVQQCTLWHLPYYLPQLALLHAFLGEREHHSRKHIDVVGQEAILVLLGPQCLLLLKADLGYNGARLLCHGRQVLTKQIV